MTEAECPTCSQTFASDHGVKIHHSVAHGERLTESRTCKQCGDEFEVTQDRGKFCEKQCYLDWAAENTGENHPNHEGQVALVCEYCGDEYEHPPSKAEGSRFCSRSCLAKGEKNWETSPEIEIECRWCGESFTAPEYYADDREYCSRGCYHDACGEHYGGEDSPHWKGGKTTVRCDTCGDETSFMPARVTEHNFCSRECHTRWLKDSPEDRLSPYYGPAGHLYKAVRSRIDSRDWEEQARNARAERCAVCGGREHLHTHHIIPVMAGGTNEEWNLITLCASCHPTVESRTLDFAPRVVLPDAYL